MPPQTLCEKPNELDWLARKGRCTVATAMPTLPPPLVLPFYAFAAIAFTCWALSVVTREYSWVDRIWSLTPQLYVGLMAYQRGFSDPRLNLMTALTTLWGARLTFNFARKGGYAKGGEDYRWAVLRARMPPAVYQVFNLVFIAGYQNFLLLLIALPAWEAYRNPTALGALDYALAGLFLLLLLGETVADQQQWNFHAAKKAGSASKRYLDTGLWAYSRHPNFFCEQAQWWVVYGFSVAAGAKAANPTLVGPVLLTLLFHGSTKFTEEITAQKYPEYAEYHARVSRLVPWFANRA
jgi:steroid 5-alpha reductase family enzyme